MSHEEIRDRILDSGAAMIATRGIGSLTLNGIADQLGCPVEEVQARFGAAEELVRAVLAERLELEGLVDALLARGTTVPAMVDFGTSTLALLTHALKVDPPSLAGEAVEPGNAAFAAAGDALANDPRIQRLVADRDLPPHVLLLILACYTHAFLSRFAPGAVDGELSDQEWVVSLVLKTLPARSK